MNVSFVCIPRNWNEEADFFFGQRCDYQEAKVIMGFWLKMESTNQILLSGLTLFFFFFLCIVLIFRNEVYLPYLQVNNSLLIF